jgi:hypothetical protein
MIICGFCAGARGQPWWCRKVMVGQIVQFWGGDWV